MSALIQLVNDNLKILSTILIVVTAIYYIVHIIYDIVTKSDIEKCLTYRGKDRILLGFVFFIINVLITMTFTIEQVIKINNESSLFRAVVVVLATSLILFFISIFIVGIAHIIFIVMKLNPIFEVEVDNNDFWRIVKVTRNNSVILQKGNMYQSLPSVSELDYKKIRLQDKKKKKKRIKRRKETKK